MTDLSRWWPLTSHHDVRRALEAAHAAPDRGYHDTRHLAEVLERLAELSVEHHFSRTEVLLAAWFHDGVYDGRPGAEDRSARWAEDALVGSDVDVSEVARLVRLTERHEPSPDDANGCALSDADLAILAAEPARYAEYAAGVREEYAHVPDRDFALGRIAVLEALVGRTWVFSTRPARERWEHVARANVARELVSLRTMAWDDAGLPDADG